MFKALQVVSFVAICASLPYAQAAIYSWQDSDGLVHFSDMPEDGAEQLQVSVGSGSEGVTQGQSMGQQSQGSENNSNQRGNRQQGGNRQNTSSDSNMLPPGDGMMPPPNTAG